MTHWHMDFLEKFREVTKHHLFAWRILHISPAPVHLQGAHLVTQTECWKRLGWKWLISELWKELGSGEREVSRDGVQWGLPASIWAPGGITMVMQSVGPLCIYMGLFLSAVLVSFRGTTLWRNEAQRRGNALFSQGGTGSYWKVETGSLIHSITYIYGVRSVSGPVPGMEN